MKTLIILVKMQLKEKLNFKRLDLSGTTVFHILLSTVLAILKFALVTVLCAAFLLISNKLGLFSLTSTVPSTVISIVFSLMLLVSVISCTMGLTKAMYFSHDNAVLLTLPCRPIQVYLSKLIIFFIFELKRNLSFMVPLFIAYYFTHNYPIGAYFWMLLCFVVISMLTVAAGSLLSIPGMWLTSFFRQHKWLQISSLVAIVAASVFALFFAISLIPEDIDLIATWGTTFWQIQDFLNAYAKNFSALYDITLLLLGETKSLITTFPLVPTAIRFVKVLGAMLVLLVAGLLIVRPLFYKMASKPFEYNKKPVKPKKNKLHTRRVTAVLNEFRIAIKSPERIFGNVGILISVPILIYLLNKIFLAMNTRDLGNYMVVAFNVLIILLVVLNANCYAASIFSKDGRSSYLIKSQPSKPMIFLLAKLLPNTLFVTLSLIITGFILLFTASLGTVDTVVLMLSVELIYLTHMLYCAETDIMNPQIEIYATIGNTDSNPNETKAAASAFLVSFLVAAVLLLLLIENAGPYTYLKLLGLSIAALLYKSYIFFSKIKLYYKEK